MTTEIKPIKLYGGVFGPNPSKTAMILCELDVPFESIYVDLGEIKAPAYEAVNPNGRLPAIEDPNTGLTLWESGAIIEYVIETYDTDHKLSSPAGTPEAHLLRQWLYFQVSGQGPYYGQAVWFRKFHPEKIQSAIDRYNNEIRRVSGVLDKWLEKREWLVGGKCTYADLAFVPWQNVASDLAKDLYDPTKEFPHLSAWLDRMNGREAVKKVVEENAQRMAAFRAGEE